MFYGVALHDGQVAVVQPSLISEPVFTLVVRWVVVRRQVAGVAWPRWLPSASSCSRSPRILPGHGLRFITATRNTLAGCGLLGMFVRRGVYAPSVRLFEEHCSEGAIAFVIMATGVIQLSLATPDHLGASRPTRL
jgi:hypothetical protein